LSLGITRVSFNLNCLKTKQNKITLLSSTATIDLFETIKKNQMVPSLESYLIAVQAVSPRNTQKALILLREIRKYFGEEPLFIPFTSILKHTGKRGGPRSPSIYEALSLFRKVDQIG